MAPKRRILIVEDELPIRNGLTDLFVFHGYEVEAAEDGKTGLTLALSGQFDLVILDVMLPEVDGFSICNEIRKRDKEQPIMMLTAKTSEEDIITGLTLGADDYVGKPFSVRQLMLRAEAVLRRSNKLKRAVRLLSLGGRLQIDLDNLEGRELSVDGKAAPSEPILFTRREIDLIEYLLQNSSRPVSRDELLSEVWGYSRNAQIETRTVDIHIAKLRRKIELDPKNPQLLVTVRGEGYKLLGEESTESESI